MYTIFKRESIKGSFGGIHPTVKTRGLSANLFCTKLKSKQENFKKRE